MPSYRPDISLGNLLTLAAMLVGLALGWQALSSSVAEMERKVTKIEIEADKLRDRVTANELTTQKTLTEIQTDMRYVRQALDQLTRSVIQRPAP